MTGDPVDRSSWADQKRWWEVPHELAWVVLPDSGISVPAIRFDSVARYEGGLLVRVLDAETTFADGEIFY